ncbi:hypothetical protein RO3G_03195 [Lichtheimia corymbifera JMRC:FSU:9682]|uniref:RBR-type E3 ubiquitin transferase n=1 Tax=Lichtheimia corymbifera JMRC:FSU:9682 TaxID=1263082 RepID=A0A068S8F1_9FUNG|nr:hypothetical protein RO3G_03195 [Lichtheimia corymbifera JMRC:FSU:9682]
MPAIFLRTLSFLIGCLYQLVLDHHTGQQRRRRRRHRNNGRGSSKWLHQQVQHSSSSTSSDSDDAMDQWILKCSICLTRHYNLCLETCRDQFCKGCFERYVEEVVQGSWGLDVTRIKCPVCLDPIRQSEWSRYVSASLVERYEQFNQPFRPFSRHCPSCRSPVIPCQSPRTKGITRQRRLEMIAEQVQSLGYPPLVIPTPFRHSTLQSLIQQLTPILRQAAQQNDRSVYMRAAIISKQLVALETVPETWKQAQFAHIATFAVDTCTHCGRDVCLQCGEYGHSGITCIDNLRRKLQQTQESAEASTVQWKLENTRGCPRCAIMICRDEGCNKVDCLYCGFQFCWSCRDPWSQRSCGFYECGKDISTQSSSSSSHYTKAELGVPDIDAIMQST